MNYQYTLRGLLSILLAAALAFSFPGLPVYAEETEPAATVETIPSGTEETEETTPAVTEETVPPTVQTQPVEPVITPISQCRESAPGIEMTIEGTVVYADRSITVLQDASGGIGLILPQDVTVEPEMVLRISGCRSAAGFVAMAWEVRGRLPLPEAEGTLGSLPECRRVVLRDATLSRGYLTQGGVSVPLAAGQPPEVKDGSRADVWGVLSGGMFYVQSLTILEEGGSEPTETQPTETQPQDPPVPLVVTATPAGGILPEGECIGLHCNGTGASIQYSYSYDGNFYSAEQPYAGGIQVDRTQGGIHIRAWAVSPAGEKGSQSDFYFTWEPPQSETPEQEGADPGWNFYFGQLHAHSVFSTGTGTPAEIFARAKESGLDFFAVTDYSENFDNSAAGSIAQPADSAEWQAGRAAAKAASDSSFVGIYGYEMTWPERPKRGHINTFGTAGWQSQLQSAFSELPAYYEALASAPDSISQFNHPGEEDYDSYGDFEDYGHYSAKYDSVIHLIEVGGENQKIDRETEYYRALDAGWHVAPTNGAAGHDVLGTGLGSGRTVILARTLTQNSLFDAIRQHRVYATEDADFYVEFTAGGASMGSTLDMEPGSLTLSFRDQSGDPVSKVELITKGGTILGGQTPNSAQGELTFSLPVGNPYYYLRLTQADGGKAITAPVWVDTTLNAGIRSFTAEKTEPLQGQQVQLSVELYNDEPADFALAALEFTMNGQVIHRAEDLETVKTLGSLPYSFPFLYDGLGSVQIQASVTGTLAGKPHRDDATLTLVYQADPAQVTLCTVAQARQGITGQVYRVKGYVTAGTLNASNTFPDKIFLQDDTAGIGITGFTDSGIQTGAPLEVTGYLALQEGEPVLQLLTYRLLSEDYYNYSPSTVPIQEATDLNKNAGKLVQVEGMVVSLTRTADGLGVARFVLRDAAGAVATVRIDNGIGSGTYGTNQLTNQVIAGRCVRAKGILIREADGTAVILVRNCDEVVAVNSVASSGAQADPTNPKTGRREPFRAPFGAGVSTPLLLAVMAVTGVGLAALYRMKRKR